MSSFLSSTLCFSLTAPLPAPFSSVAAAAATVPADTVYPNGVGRVSLSGLANGLRDLSLTLKTDHSGI